MTTETCENCGKTIGKLEPRFLFKEQVICKECDRVLNGFDVEKFTAWQKLNAISERKQTDENTLNVASVVAAVIAAIVLVPLIIFSCTCTGSDTDTWVSTEEASREEDAGDVDLSVQAHRLAKEYVTEELKCPSTAKFPWLAEDLSQFSNQIYVMRSYVDSENGFGAMIRTHFVIKIQFIRSDDDSKWNWKVLLFETT